jgi:hypothetical protein
LKARLFDMWIGDWDRHQDQWVWAGFKDGRNTLYKPIPRDRDQAFAKLDGILPSMASKPWMIRMTKNFDYTIHDVAGLNMGAILLDHNFLNALSLNDWLSGAEELQQSLTDKKIEEAFRLLPKNIYEISAEETIEKLKSRRNDLEKYAKQYYYFLAKEVNITGTAQKEFFDVERTNNDSTKLTIYKIDQHGNVSGIIYWRTFITSETNEIRLYGFGGNDQFNISGKTNKSVLIRVIGGSGKDSIIDNSTVKGWGSKTRVYDNDKNTSAEGDEIKTYISQDSLKNNYTKNLFKYDWISPNWHQAIIQVTVYILAQVSFSRNSNLEKHLMVICNLSGEIML